MLRAISDNCDEAYDAICDREFDLFEYALSLIHIFNIGAEAYAEMGLSLVGIDCDLGEDSVQIASDSYGCLLYTSRCV